MTKAIIGIYGRAGEGKSAIIRNVAQIFERHYQKAVITYFTIQNNTFVPLATGTTLPPGDILATVQLGNVKIGLESQGDPNSRMLYAKTIEKLANPNPEKEDEKLLGRCDIIVCACRTGGKTVHEIDRIANLTGHQTIWKSSYYYPPQKKAETGINRIAAEEVINLILALIAERV